MVQVGFSPAVVTTNAVKCERECNQTSYQVLAPYHPMITRAKLQTNPFCPYHRRTDRIRRGIAVNTHAIGPGQPSAVYLQSCWLTHHGFAGGAVLPRVIIGEEAGGDHCRRLLLHHCGIIACGIRWILIPHMLEQCRPPNAVFSSPRPAIDVHIRH